MKHGLLRASGACLACSLAGCAGVQSALAPAGIEAADIARLSWWLFGGAAAIWSAVIALAVVASRSGHVSVVEHPTDRVSVSDAAKRRETRRGRQLIIGGGVM